MRPLDLGSQVGALFVSDVEFFVFLDCFQLSATLGMSCFSERYGLSVVKH